MLPCNRKDVHFTSNTTKCHLFHATRKLGNVDFRSETIEMLISH